MDYSKWAETHQQQQQQPVSSQLHPTDSFSLHQPYHPYYPLYHNPSTHQPSEYGVPSSLKLPQNGPHYSAPPSMASQSHNALDISQSDTSLRPPGSESYAPMGPPTMSSYTPQSGFEGQGPYHTHIPGAMPPNLGYYQDPETQSWAAKEAIKQFGADPLVFGAAMRPSNGPNFNPLAWNRPSSVINGRGFPKKMKKTKVVQSAWCAVCKIDCNSKDVLDKHKSGRKHQNKLKQLEEMANNANKAPEKAPKEKVEPTPQVGPKNPTVKTPEIPAPKVESQNAEKKRKKKAAILEDVETKKKKVLDGGAAADAVRVCTLCGTVCNSETVFKFHLEGKRHAAQVKKAGGKNVTGA
ncbi:uncharacterized protein LOC18427970 [Amborella trichopoda]|uniref:U1-type domain-containing protein n=1 Tax=Amborella trichopoda TaxID=13333 RepID=W1NWC6_AMBTC|nr:uncharacterized protein LOC18427970 [Amborella trichopoda]XP_020519161.1 uncharacterized protein LOC18427970 [Amborella trichopoda]ERM99927.1 hypothetical protein AMTR_s00110p00088680 [Amborella trichopoda]|eukprot:XP_006837074.1 uncharacterized protein LOC18427970 [Amborella trichopoda]